ncbi:MAG: hypothetical protein KGL59_04975 [Acidobacteriota bacterium]|nr:hypothetical protein [Acidobacteriota bacterium]
MRIRLLPPRLPLAAFALFTLVIGLWAALLRMGWNLPWLQSGQALAHGPLMVCGFLGTLISLERAVALGRGWGYLAPGLAALGGAALIAGVPGLAAPVLIFLASLVLIAIFAVIVRRQPAMFTVTMTAGAIAWAIGNVLWLAGVPIPEMVHWWMAFLVLTIVGERLELSRFLPPSRYGRPLFTAAVAFYVAGLAGSSLAPISGHAVLGVGMVAMSAWLARFDIARFTLRQGGLPRFAAVCLLAGYVWLAAGGIFAMLADRWPSVVELRYDAMLHTVFLGFVFSMIFAHAPIIFPAVTGLRLPFRPVFYTHVLLLQLSLAWRIAGDCADSFAAYHWGGLLNVAAVLLFLGNTACALLLGFRKPGHADALFALSLPERVKNSRTAPRAAKRSHVEAD